MRRSASAGPRSATTRPSPGPPSLELVDVDAALRSIGAASGPARRRPAGARSRALLAARPTRSSDFLAPSSSASSARARSRASSRTAIARAAESRRRRCGARSCSPATSARSRGGARRGRAGLARFRLELFRPLQPMLAQTAERPREALERVGAAVGGVEARRRADPGASPRRRGPGLTPATSTTSPTACPRSSRPCSRSPVEAVVLDGEVIALAPDGAAASVPGHDEPVRQQARRATRCRASCR